MLTVDGSMGEGGGQIFRIALAWSALSSEPVRINRIRAGRAVPGLRPQHLTALIALKEICNAEVSGDRIGSQEVTFIPQRPRGGKYVFDCGTAGSITLMIQAILPSLLMADSPSIVRLKGGTDVKWSPPVDHTRYVLFPAISMMGASAYIELIRRGYYPEGGGEVILHVKPSKIRGIDLTGEEIEEIRGIVHYSNLPEHIAKRMKRSALKELIGMNVHIDIENSRAISKGTGISLWSSGKHHSIGGSALGEKGIPAENIGSRAAQEIKENIEKRVGVDIHLADQILIYMAMSEDSRISTPHISSHAKTAMELLHIMSGLEFEVRKDGVYVIETGKD